MGVEKGAVAGDLAVVVELDMALVLVLEVGEELLRCCCILLRRLGCKACYHRRVGLKLELVQCP